MKRNLIVAGIDPSLSSTAVTFIDVDAEAPINSYLIETKKEVTKEDDGKKKKATKLSGEEIVERLERQYEIFRRLKTLLFDNKPDYIAIEGYSFMGTNLAIQAEVTGVINLAVSIYTKLIKKQVKVVYFTPQSLKKFLLGKGASQHKELILKEVYKQYNFDVDNNNLADAFVLAKMCLDYCYMCNGSMRKGIKKYQLEIFLNLYATPKEIKTVIKQKLKGK